MTFANNRRAIISPHRVLIGFAGRLSLPGILPLLFLASQAHAAAVSSKENCLSWPLISLVATQSIDVAPSNPPNGLYFLGDGIAIEHGDAVATTGLQSLTARVDTVTVIPTASSADPADMLDKSRFWQGYDFGATGTSGRAPGPDGGPVGPAPWDCASLILVSVSANDEGETVAADTYQFSAYSQDDGLGSAYVGPTIGVPSSGGICGGPRGGGGPSGCGAVEGGSGSGGGCGTCTNSSGPRTGGPAMFGLGSSLARFSLGMISDRRSAGVLRIHEEGPPTGPSLASRARLKYDAESWLNESYFRIQAKYQGGYIRQLLTNNLLVDLVDQSSTAYQMKFYDLLYDNDLGIDSTTGLWVPQNQALLLHQYDVSEGANSNELMIRHFQRPTDTSPNLTQKETVTYTYNEGSWTFTRHSESMYIDYVEVVTPWTYDETGFIRTRSYLHQRPVLPGSPTLVESYRETQQDTKYQYHTLAPLVWRRTKRIVDPGEGHFNLTTTWTYTTQGVGGARGVVLKLITRPDGSWTWYNIGKYGDPEGPCYHPSPFYRPPWIYEAISGLKDTPPPSLELPPDPNSSTVSTVRAMFRNNEWSCRYIRTVHEEKIGGELIQKWEEQDSGGTETTRTYWRDGPNTESYVIDWSWWDSAFLDEHPVQMRRYARKITSPSGTVDLAPATDYWGWYSNLLIINSYPNSHTWNSGSGQVLVRYYQAQHNGNGDEPVPWKSTRSERFNDGRGRTLFERELVYTGAGTDPWKEFRSRSRLFDRLGRVTEEWDNRGQHWKFEYQSCCSVVQTDPNGVVIERHHDTMGRTTFELKQVPGQSPISTTYTYEPLAASMTISAGDLPSVTTRREFDLAGRAAATITNKNTPGALKSSIVYGTTPEGGSREITYSAYPEDAVNGIPGLREIITDFYADGRIKSRTGSIIGTYYDYGAANNETWVRVSTGSADSPRYQDSFYDLRGRLKRQQRPGWSASGTPPTLTTTYTYDATARLVQMQPPDGALVTYEYDELDHRFRTTTRVSLINPAAEDRISEIESEFESDGSNYWHTTRSWVYPPNSTVPKLVSRSKTRLTGFLGSDEVEFIAAESRSYDSLDNETISETRIERDAATRRTRTKSPESTFWSEEKTIGGRTVESISSTNVKTSYLYDAFGRQRFVEDARGNTTESIYDESGRVITSKDGAGNATNFAYYLGNDTGANDPNSGVFPGRLKSTLNANGKYSYFAYTNRGQSWRTWGHIPYPTETLYDATYGDRTELHTFRTSAAWGGPGWPTSSVTADATKWTYHPATGLVNAKTYADNTSMSYEYTIDGKPSKRFWARDFNGQPLSTSYSYDSATGELLTVNYADDTPDVTYTYDRLGRQATVSDAAGMRTLAYHDESTLRPKSESFESGMFNSLVVKQMYESGSPGVSGRWNGLLIGTTADEDAYYKAQYGYDAYGRLNHVTGPGLPAGDDVENGAWYTYMTTATGNTDLLDHTEIRQTSTDVKVWTDWDYENARDFVTGVTNNFGTLGSGTAISKYEYVYDGLARRQGVVYTGAAFASGGIIDDWVYNNRNELKATDRKAGNATTLISHSDQPDSVADILDRRYTYDPIGNRITPVNNDGTLPDGPVSNYVPNPLNQYDTIRIDNPAGGQGFNYDEDGNLAETFVAADIDGDGEVTMSDLSLFFNMFGLTCACWQSTPATCDQSEFDRADMDGDCDIDISDQSYFLSLFGTSGDLALQKRYVWDAENRLVRVEPAEAQPLNGQLKIEFKYDYRGRRIEKKASTYDGTTWNVTSTRRFVWNGWSMLMELEGSAPISSGILKKFTWGRDLGGALESVGGIGGLLAVQDFGGSPTLSYCYIYDANGNVGQVVDWAATGSGVPSGSLVAQYEYDAYGNVSASNGTYATANTYRFSTKSWDDETGLGYWGYRYYEPRMGRWVNRDPLGESAGPNVNLFVSNRSISNIDSLGEEDRSANECCTCDSMRTSLDMDELCADLKTMTCLNGKPPDCPATQCKNGLRRGALGTYNENDDVISIDCKQGAALSKDEFRCVMVHEICHAKQRCKHGVRPNKSKDLCLSIEADCYVAGCKCLGKSSREDITECCEGKSRGVGGARASCYGYDPPIDDTDLHDACAKAAHKATKR